MTDRDDADGAARDSAAPEARRIDPAAARARTHDATRGFGAVDSDPPVIVWKCASKKRHRLLRVYRTPRGWLLLSDSFSRPLDEWLKRIGAEHTVDDMREGRVAAFHAREVAGHQRMLPLDVDDWERARFELGCRCGTGWHGLATVAEDARKFLATHRRVERRIEQ